MRNSVAELERDLSNARNYREWHEVGERLDELDGSSSWRAEDESSDYDYALLRERLTELRGLKTANNVARLIFWLHEGLHNNIGNIMNPALYQRARAGTKRLISTYVEEVASVLNYLCDGDFQDLAFEQKMKFFKRTGKVFGRPALMLSGGATLGIFHLGVVKALWLQGLLPRVISGSSAGSIIAGVAGCYDDDELPSFFEAERLETRVWRTVGLREGLRRRALIDPTPLQHGLERNIGERSFVEAFQHTGRIVNITVSPVQAQQRPLLLNYLTTPTVLVRSGSLASCAVPGLFAPVTLQARTLEGGVIPYIPQHKWSDGTLKSDLPMLRLSRLHNVNYYIVSQTNPHVLPFLHEEKPAVGLLSSARRFISEGTRLNGKHVLELAREHVDSAGLSRVLDEVHGIVRQSYRGDITVAPKVSLTRLRRIFTDPSLDEVNAFIAEGERAIWPRIEQIRVATAISATLDDCITRLKVAHGERPAGPTKVQVPWARPSV